MSLVHNTATSINNLVQHTCRKERGGKGGVGKGGLLNAPHEFSSACTIVYVYQLSSQF